MRFQGIDAYTGDEPFIFLSYSHKDAVSAEEITIGLMDAGYRVWYDEGLTPAKEWDENVALSVENCSYFVALISQNYLDSDNCRDELNYARDCEKPRLLLYLENVELPRGMRMRLNRLMAVFRWEYKDISDLINKISTAEGIEVCGGNIQQDSSADAHLRLYQAAVEMLDKDDLASLSAAEGILRSLGDYQDANMLLEACSKRIVHLQELQRQQEEARLAQLRQQEEEARQKREYQRAMNLMAKGDEPSLSAAESIFKELGQYQDAAEQAEKCRQELGQKEKEREEARLAQLRQQEEARLAQLRQQEEEARQKREYQRALNLMAKGDEPS